MNNKDVKRVARAPPSPPVVKIERTAPKDRNYHHQQRSLALRPPPPGKPERTATRDRNYRRRQKRLPPTPPEMAKIERIPPEDRNYRRRHDDDWLESNLGWHNNKWWQETNWRQNKIPDWERDNTWYSSSSETGDGPDYDDDDDDDLVLLNNAADLAGDEKKDQHEKRIVSFRSGDPRNPYNWSPARKLWVVFVGILTVINSTLGSSLPSNATEFIIEEFGIISEQQSVLPTTLFLIGYVLGPLIFAPISEQYGRKWVTQVAFFVYMVFTMACALSPNFAALVVFRLFCGITASAPIVVTGGLFADIYSDPIMRGRTMALLQAATTCGPLFSPIISGYCSQNPSLGWRWTFWIGLIIAGASSIPLLLLPETFGPIILTWRAQRWREETGDSNYISQHEIQIRERTFNDLITRILLRPVSMLCTEPIVLSTSLYLSVAYAILYMFFSGAYGVVFSEIYGLSPGVSGLMFLPIGGGTIIAMILFLWYEKYYIKSRNLGKAWTRKEEAARIPLAFLGGPLLVIALFWQGWTARPAVHWVVPMLAGIPFGAGFLLIFMALFTYLTDAYEVFAASALAATSMCRSVFGALMPLGAERMYHVLGPGWASSTIAFVSLAMSLTPFVFWIWGDRIRSASPFCQELRKKKEEQQKGG